MVYFNSYFQNNIIIFILCTFVTDPTIQDGYLPSFIVDVSNTNKTDSFLPSELCFSYDQTVDPGLFQVNRSCSQGLVGRYVTLIRHNFSYQPSWFKLCEVSVFGTTFTGQLRITRHKFCLIIIFTYIDGLVYKPSYIIARSS